MTIEVIPSVTGMKYSNGDGYYFRLSQKLNNKFYLNCQVKNCRVRGNLPVHYTLEDKINAKGQHNHPPDFYEAEFCQVEKRILERAAKDPTALRMIFAEETAKVSPKTLSRLNYPSFIRRMQRRRQFTVGLVPSSLKDFAKRMRSSEYEEYTYIDGKRFFIDAIKNHSVLYVSPTTRELLKWDDQSYVIYQTRKMITQNLKNVMIIAHIQRNVAFPIIYVAMQQRTKTAYVDVFNKIQEDEPSWTPSTLYVNNQESLISAISETLSSCEIVCSWFHLAQELRKKVKDLDLISLLHSDPDFFNFVELLQLIPLLPVEFMRTGLEIMNQKIQPLLSKRVGISGLIQYINNSWLTGSQSTLFSIFNKLERLKIEMKLLHRQFMCSFRSNSRKDAIWSFTKGLVVLERKYAEAYKELINTDSPPKWTGNCSYRSQERRIRNAMLSFSNGKLTVEAFLETIEKTSINIMDLNEEDIHEVSDDENDTKTLTDSIKTESIEDSESSNDGLGEFDDYIVEVEEYFEDGVSRTSGRQHSTAIKTFQTDSSPKCDISNIKINSLVNSQYQIDQENDVNKIKIEVLRESCQKIGMCIDKQILVFGSTPVKPEFNWKSNVFHACVLCKNKTYSFACQPCGHLCLCSLCCSNIVKKTCPMCPKEVMWVQQIILAQPLE